MSSTERKRRIAVLISGSGTNLQALIDALNTPALPNAEIVLVVSNRKAAYGLTRAQTASPPIPTAYLPLPPFFKQYPDDPQKARQEYDAAVAREVCASHPDIVVLAGWMHILSQRFLDILEGREAPQSTSHHIPIPTINLHPALPGQFDGANALSRAFAAFQRGEITYTGAMVHRVVREVDRGEPIVVREVRFEEGEDEEAFVQRMHAVEHEIVVEGTRKVLQEINQS